MNTIGRIILLAGIIIPFHLLHAQSGLETQAQLQALEQTEPTAAATVSVTGRFYPASLANQGIFAPIYPSNLGHPAWNLGDVVWLVDDLPTASGRGMRAMGMDGSGGPFPGGGGTNDYGDGGDYTNNYVRYTFDTNQLWLEVTNISGGTVFANLHNATNLVYAIWSTTDLTTPFAGWQVETEVWPSDTNCQPFNLPTLDRQNLFLRAEDWTGVDSDGDGVPDWWSWLYWATNNLPDTNLDYSGSSDTFAQDYSNSITPTVFSFTGIDVTNNYVSTMSAAAQLDVSGSPYYIAISMDDTNYAADAVWEDYSGSNVMVNLGITEGWHDVWIGLRGHADDVSAAVWQWQRLKLDYTAPQLFITGPTNGTVDTPLIQLTGFSSEDLSGISYDLSNAAGMVTNQLVLIEDRAYDTSTWEFTTNNFQGYDILLTNGVNTLTVHATDLAGNPATLTTNITYSPTTNLVAVSLLWPQDGMQICGSSFTVKGQASDPTTGVSVNIVDGAGNTNVVGGLIGRDGVLWVENVPLGTGTNNVLLTVGTANGDTNISFNVIQSSVGLGINTVQAGDTNMSGTMDTDGYTIWVNGNQATNDSYGGWTAQIAPLGIGGGLVQVTAVPDTENGGALTNPISPASVSADLAVDAPQGVYLSGYYEKEQNALAVNQPYSMSNTTFWQDGLGGTADWDEWNGTNLVSEDGYAWAASAWPQPLAALTITEGGTAGTEPSLVQEHCDIAWMNATATGSRTADAEMKLATGGPLGSKAMNLWCLSATATDAETGQPIPPEQIEIGGFGYQDTNAELWVMLPDNDPPVVTPRVKWKKNYKFTVSGREYPLIIMANEMTLSDKYVWPGRDFCVGEGVYFNVVGMPDYSEAVATWTLPGNFVNRQPDTNCLAYFDVDTNLLTRNSVTNGALTTSCWYVQDLPAAEVGVTVSYRFTKTGPWFTNTLSGKFNVHRPTTAQATPYQPDGTPTVQVVGEVLTLGNGRTNDMSFQHTITTDAYCAGQVGYVQVTDGDYTDPLLLTCSEQPINGPALDGAFGEFPTDRQTSVSTNASSSLLAPFYDGPHDVMYNNDCAQEDLSFQTYLMFQPPGGIWVPLRLITWELHDEAANGALVNGAEHVTQPPNDQPTTDFPKWTKPFSRF